MCSTVVSHLYAGLSASRTDSVRNVPTIIVDPATFLGRKLIPAVRTNQLAAGQVWQDHCNESSDQQADNDNRSNSVDHHRVGMTYTQDQRTKKSCRRGDHKGHCRSYDPCAKIHFHALPFPQKIKFSVPFLLYHIHYIMSITNYGPLNEPIAQYK